MNPDVALFHFFNNLAGVSPVLDWVVRALVNDYGVPTLYALMLAGLWFMGDTAEARRAHQRAILIALLGLVLTNALIRILQIYYFRPRPFATETVHLLFYRPSVSSFPSVPVATLFCYVTGIWKADRKWGLIMLILAMAFGLSRIIAGVHYPLDIVGGALWGIICTLLAGRLARYLDPLLNRLFAIGERFNLA